VTKETGEDQDLKYDENENQSNPESSRDEESSEYHLNFGLHLGLTLEDAARLDASQQVLDAPYIEWLIGSELADHDPELVDALKHFGSRLYGVMDCEE
jgi:hypothetical protein